MPIDATPTPQPTRFSFHTEPRAGIDHAISLAPSAVAMPPDWISRVNELSNHQKMQLLIGYWTAGKASERAIDPNDTLRRERDQARNERDDATKHYHEAKRFSEGHFERENMLDDKRRFVTKCFAWTGGTAAATLIPALGWIAYKQHHTEKTIRNFACELHSLQSSQ